MQELSKWQSKGFTPTETTRTNFIQHHLHNGDFAAALRACDDLKLLANKPTQLAQVFNARMLVHSTRGDVAACRQELAEMTAQGVAHDEVSYLRLVDAHVRARDLSAARGALTEMLLGGFVTDNTAHCALLSAYAQKGDLPMCAQLAEEMRAQGMRPTSLAYSQWFDALCEAQDISGALRVLGEMKEMEKRIPLAIWAKVMDSGWKDKKKRAQVYEKIKQSEFSPAAVYLVLVEMEVLKEKWENVLELMQDLRSRGGTLDYALYEKMAKVHEKMGNAEMWLRVVNEARGRGFHLPVPQHLFLSISQHADVTTCARLFEMMQEGREGDKISKKAYEAMVELWARAGSMQNAQKLIEEMKGEGEVPSVELMNKMMQEVYKKAKWDLCIEIFKEMQQNGISPLSSTLEMMIIAYGVKKDVKEAQKLWMASEKGELSNSMVFAYATSGDTKNAIQLFKEMKEKGIKMNEMAYAAMISIFGKKGDLGEVERLYKEVLEKRIEHGERVSNAVLMAYTAQGRVKESKKEKEGERGEKGGSLEGLLRRLEHHSEAKKFMNVLKSLKIVL
jgi:leucine-rich PPR motif-containing protein